MQSAPLANSKLTNLVEEHESAHGQLSPAATTNRGVGLGGTNSDNRIGHDGVSSEYPMANRGHPLRKSIDVLDYQKQDLSHVRNPSNVPNASHIPNESLDHTRTSSTSGLKGTALKLKSKLSRHRNKAGDFDSSSGEELEDTTTVHPRTSYDLNKTNTANLPHVDRKTLPQNSTLPTPSSSSSHHTSSHDPKTNMNSTTLTHLASAGINLENTTSTTQHTHTAPAVTHETINPVVTEIQTKQITRDIHTTDVLYRIQPIKETVVLPARHFVESLSGVRYEVPEHRVQELVDLNMRQLGDELREREMGKPLPPTPGGEEGGRLG